MDLAKALDDLEHMADGMLATVVKGGAIVRTEVIELQRRISVVRESAEPKKKAKSGAAEPESE